MPRPPCARQTQGRKNARRMSRETRIPVRMSPKAACEPTCDDPPDLRGTPEPPPGTSVRPNPCDQTLATSYSCRSSSCPVHPARAKPKVGKTQDAYLEKLAPPYACLRKPHANRPAMTLQTREGRRSLHRGRQSGQILSTKLLQRHTLVEALHAPSTLRAPNPRSEKRETHVLRNSHPRTHVSESRMRTDLR